MTLDETKKVIAVIISAYPNYHPADIKAVVSVWKELLEDHSYECVSTALRMYMSTDSNGFAPSPGQIIERVKLLTSERRLNEIEAWTLVRKAIQNSGYNSVEEYAKLPEEVQKAVGQPEQLRIWALDEHYNESVVSAAFMRSYRTELKRSEDISKLPQKLQENIRGKEGKQYAEITRKFQEAVERLSAEKKLEGKLEVSKSQMPERCVQKMAEMKMIGGALF